MKVRFEFTITYKDDVLSFWKESDIPCLPPVGTYVTFDNEEGESRVESICLQVATSGCESNYSVILDSVDLSEDYNSAEEVKRHFVPRGWNELYDDHRPR